MQLCVKGPPSHTEDTYWAEVHENHLISVWSFLVSSLKEVVLAGTTVPVLSAVVRVAESASAVQRSRCRGASFRKESQDSPSSDGGFAGLLGFFSGADPQHSQLPTCVCIVTQCPRALRFLPWQTTRCGLRTQSLGADVSER